MSVADTAAVSTQEQYTVVLLSVVSAVVFTVVVSAAVVVTSCVYSCFMQTRQRLIRFPGKSPLSVVGFGLLQRRKFMLLQSELLKTI